jgi:hypothetical protein
MKDRDTLIYSDLYDQWINAPIQDFVPIMIGTNGMVSGSSGLVPAPQSH